MKKVIRIKNLDCAHCAAKMQANVEKIDGVNQASVNFLTQKVVLDVDESIAGGIAEAVLQACKRVDADVELA